MKIKKGDKVRFSKSFIRGFPACTDAKNWAIQWHGKAINVRDPYNIWIRNKYGKVSTYSSENLRVVE